MPDVDIHIGGRTFQVACQEGEESYLHSAAGMLDREAAVLVDQIGRIPEARMLLMAGLMLADRTAASEDKVTELEAELANRDARIAELENRPAPEPEQIEVPVIPPEVTQPFADLAARAETLADLAEEKAQG